MPHDKSGLDHSTHSNLEIKEVGNAIVALREEIALPFHRAIYNYAIKGKSFEECLGLIAVKLDIALDGVYDPDDLCAFLCTALRAKRILGYSNSQIHEIAELQIVELHEKEETVELVKVEKEEKTTLLETEGEVKTTSGAQKLVN